MIQARKQSEFCLLLPGAFHCSTALDCAGSQTPPQSPPFFHTALTVILQTFHFPPPLTESQRELRKPQLYPSFPGGVLSSSLLCSAHQFLTWKLPRRAIPNIAWCDKGEGSRKRHFFFAFLFCFPNQNSRLHSTPQYGNTHSAHWFEESCWTQLAASPQPAVCLSPQHLRSHQPTDLAFQGQLGTRQGDAHSNQEAHSTKPGANTYTHSLWVWGVGETTLPKWFANTKHW